MRINWFVVDFRGWVVSEHRTWLGAAFKAYTRGNAYVVRR